MVAKYVVASQLSINTVEIVACGWSRRQQLSLRLFNLNLSFRLLVCVVVLYFGFFNGCSLLSKKRFKRS